MKNTYSPREFAGLISRTVKTLQRWDREKSLVAHRTANNRRYYTHDQYVAFTGQRVSEKKIVSYCRVSSAGQKVDLASQKSAVEQFCIASGKAVALALEDVGAGLNYRRKNFLLLMEMVERNEIEEIVIAHKDRLVRFGFEWFEKFCADHGAKITVMNAESLSPEEEMTKDLLSIIHCFSSRLYGLRKYKKKIMDMASEQPE
jgi:predicted site-specific integrase-resolvase